MFWWPDPALSFLAAIPAGSCYHLFEENQPLLVVVGSSSLWHPGCSSHFQPLIEQILNFLFACLIKYSRTVGGEFKCFTAFLGDMARCFMMRMVINNRASSKLIQTPPSLFILLSVCLYLFEIHTVFLPQVVDSAVGKIRFSCTTIAIRANMHNIVNLTSRKVHLPIKL